jgi:mono/diheme cytochrome c family protein
VKNPLPQLNATQLKEAERLYLVNCGICHGQKLDGNGPLYNGGNGPYAAAPRNLVTDPVVANMPDGQMFYSITYGKGAMGPYGPQLSTSQRWMIVHYINAKQNEAGGGSAAPAQSDSTAVSSGDSAATAKK